MLRLTKCALIALLVALVAMIAPATVLGYSQTTTTECAACHGAAGEDPGSWAEVRKGPHGAYSAGTSRCQTCHSIHHAPAGGNKLLPASTIKETCESCHDGTGGTGVYGVIKARTGADPAATHRIDIATVIPGGDPSGKEVPGVFSGPGDTLTCSDCHSPHDGATVQPFTGDRLRASADSETAFEVKTNRLLRRAPGGGEASVAVYGAGWCATCHKARLARHSAESGEMRQHPVSQSDAYFYDNLPVVTGVGSVTTTIGALGQSNRGYVMPGPNPTEPTLKTPLQEGRGPICQQCHEDARAVGPAVRGTNPKLTGAAQEFRVTAYGEDAPPTENPRYQTFPHESDKANFLVRAPEPAEPHSLCLNCHSLLHAAAPGSGYVQVFDERHDDVSGDSDGIGAPCTTCHVTDLLPIHADKCSACHPEPYETLEPSWAAGCQQGGCHTSYHAGPFDAHWEAYDTQPCEVCHPASGWWPRPVDCLNCHASSSSTSPPVTSSNARPTYDGAALIDFAITKGGKAGLGTTYYRVDGGATLSGGRALVVAPGAHSIEFWSVDQNGLTEASHKSAVFTIVADSAPPVTTSNAQATYYWYNAAITLTATDASSQGVKATYYSIDGGPAQTGTHITVPAVDGAVAHTLTFWSEDWSGNVESVNTAAFTIVRQTGTIRLVWGNSDVEGQPGPSEDGEEAASWTIRAGGATGPIVATGSATGEGWDGVDDVVVPVRAVPYYVHVQYWYWEYLGFPAGWELIPDTRVFPSAAVTSAGEIVRLSY